MTLSWGTQQTPPKEPGNKRPNPSSLLSSDPAVDPLGQRAQVCAVMEGIWRDTQEIPDCSGILKSETPMPPLAPRSATQSESSAMPQSEGPSIEALSKLYSHTRSLHTPPPSIPSSWQSHHGKDNPGATHTGAMLTALGHPGVLPGRRDTHLGWEGRDK